MKKRNKLENIDERKGIEKGIEKGILTKKFWVK